MPEVYTLQDFKNIREDITHPSIARCQLTLYDILVLCLCYEKE